MIFGIFNDKSCEYIHKTCLESMRINNFSDLLLTMRKYAVFRVPSTYVSPKSEDYSFPAQGI